MSAKLLIEGLQILTKELDSKDWARELARDEEFYRKNHSHIREEEYEELRQSLLTQ